MTHVAFADRAGVIPSAGAARRAHCRSAGIAASSPCMTLLSAVARLAHDNETLLVPGVPEAKSEDAALAAVVTFVKTVETRLKERAS